jgi:malate dehydrogenase (oxaloacetate-decarboxylating)(NADP+)
MMDLLVDEKRGFDLLHDPDLNKGTAFTQEERETYGLAGLLPPYIATMDQQVERVMAGLRGKPSDLEKHIFLVSLQERNRTLFYRVVVDHLEEIMPLIYTPTVGEACESYAHIFRRPQGMYLSIEDKGMIAERLKNWPLDDVRVIVVTDGERILGLGDLGTNGMGIPVGKLSLYVACAGIRPSQTLPITLDVGTNNEAFLEDPLYLGHRHRRVRGEAYDALVSEFVDAIHARFPKALLQFEDFGNQNAFRLLKTFRKKLPTFNDDIQGTAAVTVAGIFSALRLNGQDLLQQKYLFMGAGEAGIGIGELIVAAMMEAGLSEEAAMERCWFFDSQGLVVKSREGLQPHKLAFAHDAPFLTGFREAVEFLRPTGIIGVSGQPQTFTEPTVREMAAINQRPLVFALSNPTRKAECTAEQAYEWSRGRAIFASGSPFPPVSAYGRQFVPGQANNAYVFPGIGLGVLASEATLVSDSMFLAAAKALAEIVTEDDLAQGRIFPPLSDIREISAAIGAAVARTAEAEGLARATLPDDLEATLRAQMYEPVYD